MKYLLLLLSFSVHADIYIGAGVGSNNPFYSSNWNDQGEMGCMLTIKHVTDLNDYRVSVGYQHFSQCMAGVPFDDRTESTLDHVGVMVEYRVF